MSKKDDIINFYSHIKKGRGVDKPLNDDIKLNSRILIIGGSATGKSNIALNFINRNPNRFYKIIIFTSNSEEPLLNLLSEKIPDGVEIYNDIDEVPDVEEFADDAETPKLIIFDDFINLKPKEMTKIKKYSTVSRKFGFTSLYLVQNIVDCPKQVVRNANYIMLLKLNDNSTINNIIKNFNLFDLPKAVIMDIYHRATSRKFDFLFMNLNAEDINHYLAYSFKGYLNIEKVE